MLSALALVSDLSILWPTGPKTLGDPAAVQARTARRTEPHVAALNELVARIRGAKARARDPPRIASGSDLDRCLGAGLGNRLLPERAAAG